VIEENLLKQLWSQSQEVPANQLVQKYLTIVCRGIQEARDTSTIEKESFSQGNPATAVNQEGPSGATQASTPTVVKKRPPPQSRPKQTVKRHRRKVLTAQEVEEQEHEENEEQDKLKMEAAMGASKIVELEEAKVHLEQQMNLVSTQRQELDQLEDQLENEKALRTAMGNNAIRKDEAIEEARQLTAKTIDALEDLVGQLTKELAKTKDQLVAA
jgi:hypothetical protein